ncbi:arginine-ornithine antiporter [Nordella sp. HKS 07]|uniref:arginine-ornithine antiporter n=1 Tax=Nordella sp. HKS 07 TaxID=2712222 RepID=UPI0013E194C9|nr:arginine-ornithine antiporter [Nordella sp. HKS 07]QIG47115.1 arginine-ornithine antiporter [Nordella sp. HKS 07]
MTEAATAKLKLASLIGIVVGSMIGGGIFALPQVIAAHAGPGGALLGWLVTGIGMLMLARIFQSLALRKPELDAGVFAYAQAGFGNFIGHGSAWGYWMSAWIGNVSFLVLLFSSLGLFFPVFGQGDTPAAVICASLLLWALHFMVLRGIEQAAAINAVATAAKIVPIAIFILIAIFAFDSELFFADFWGAQSPDLGGVASQVRGMMLVTVFVFIGVEGANVYSGRAEKRSDVGIATIAGFLGVLLLLILVNVLSFGVMSRADLAHLPNPSMAEVLRSVVGRWGAILVAAGLAISLLGALLSWTLLCAEILSAAARGHALPQLFGRENARGVPAPALWLTNILVQVFLLATLLLSSAYVTLLNLATTMILLPYLWSAAYAAKLAWTGETYREEPRLRHIDLARSLIAVAYALWIIYAGGLKYLLLSAILYAPGILLFWWARTEQRQPPFTSVERYYAGACIVAAVIGLAGLLSGHIRS